VIDLPSFVGGSMNSKHLRFLWSFAERQKSILEEGGEHIEQVAQIAQNCSSIAWRAARVCLPARSHLKINSKALRRAMIEKRRKEDVANSKEKE
jgi:hypothetical protein